MLTIRLASRQDPPEPWQQHPEPRPTPKRLATARIMVVEDDEMVRLIAERVLNEAGYEVMTAADGRDALAQLGTGAAVDLLITDIRMPYMDGRQLGTRVSAINPAIPVIYISGYAADWGARIGEGANRAFLQKPFDAEAMLRAVRRLLDEP